MYLFFLVLLSAFSASADTTVWVSAWLLPLLTCPSFLLSSYLISPTPRAAVVVFNYFRTDGLTKMCWVVVAGNGSLALRADADARPGVSGKQQRGA